MNPGPGLPLSRRSPSPPSPSVCHVRRPVCLLVGCLTSQQHASVSQGRVRRPDERLNGRTNTSDFHTLKCYSCGEEITMIMSKITLSKQEAKPNQIFNNSTKQYNHYDNCNSTFSWVFSTLILKNMNGNSP